MVMDWRPPSQINSIVDNLCLIIVSSSLLNKESQVLPWRPSPKPLGTF